MRTDTDANTDAYAVDAEMDELAGRGSQSAAGVLALGGCPCRLKDVCLVKALPRLP